MKENRNKLKIKAGAQVNILLKEYEIAHKDFQGINSLVWNTFYYINTLSIAGFGLVLREVLTDKRNWPFVIGIGFPIITILICWFLLFSRWEKFSKVDLYRMCEIENLLGFYRTRYGTWLRQGKKAIDQHKLNRKDKNRFNALFKSFTRFPSQNFKQYNLIGFIIVSEIFSWFFLIYYTFAKMN